MPAFRAAACSAVSRTKNADPSPDTMPARSAANGSMARAGSVGALLMP